MSTLYSRIVDSCKEINITGYRLCKDCGISPSVITDLGKGRKKNLSADYANKFANRLGVSVDWLITGEEREHIDNEKSPASENAELKEAGYYDLSPDNKAVIDDLIAKLLKSQSAE